MKAWLPMFVTLSAFAFFVTATVAETREALTPAPSPLTPHAKGAGTFEFDSKEGGILPPTQNRAQTWTTWSIAEMLKGDLRAPGRDEPSAYPRFPVLVFSFPAGRAP